MRINGKAMTDRSGTAQRPASPGALDEIALPDGLFTAWPTLLPVEARRAYALVALAHPHVTAREWDGPWIATSLRSSQWRGTMGANVEGRTSAFGLVPCPAATRTIQARSASA